MESAVEWQVSLRDVRGRNHRRGEIVEAHEEQPHVLVSTTHVRQNWSAEQQLWFSQYAYPLADEVFVSWSQDPEQWKPINHSCDPNAWLVGLDLVARKEISAGTEITIDYGTFYNEQMAEFACTCGAAECRKVIRGTDYGSPSSRGTAIMFRTTSALNGLKQVDQLRRVNQSRKWPQTFFTHISEKSA